MNPGNHGIGPRAQSNRNLFVHHRATATFAVLATEVDVNHDHVATDTNVGVIHNHTVVRDTRPNVDRRRLAAHRARRRRYARKPTPRGRAEAQYDQEQQYVLLHRSPPCSSVFGPLHSALPRSAVVHRIRSSCTHAESRSRRSWSAAGGHHPSAETGRKHGTRWRNALEPVAACPSIERITYGRRMLLYGRSVNCGDYVFRVIISEDVPQPTPLRPVRGITGDARCGMT